MPKRGMPWWGALAVTAVLVASLGAVVLLAAAVQSKAHGVPLEEGLRVVTLDPLNLALAQAVACGAALWLAFRWLGEGSLRTRLDVEPVSHGVVALALVAGLAAQFPLTEMENLLREAWPVPMTQQLRLRRFVTPEGVGNAFAIVLALVVVAPVGEELVFRGAILGGLERRHGTKVGLGVSSVLFGAAHLGLAQPMPAGALAAVAAGLLLGAVAVRTRSILPCVAMHAGVNAVPILLPERVIAIRGLNTISEEVYHLPAPLLLSSTVVAAAALLGLMWLADRDER